VSSDDDKNPAPHPKRSKGRKESKHNTVVVDSDDQVSKKGKPAVAVASENAMDIDSSSDDQVNIKAKYKKPVKATNRDFEMENSEDELGEL
jgi:hypothetical protein